MNSTSGLSRIFFLLCVLTTITWQSAAMAAQLQLTWSDNSTNETGFKVQRKTGTTGTYADIASVGANVTSYTDASLMNATTYCFRVNAFNTNGNSPYSPDACGTTASTIQTFSLAVVKAGTGTGTVSSSPAGINCGSTCSGTYDSGTTVTLTATPAAGSTFAGWSGTGCSSSSIVLMTSNRNCTATFNATPQQFTLNVTVVQTATSYGTGNGTVTSSPAGINNCSGTCSASYDSGTIVSLTPTPTSGSTFGGWTGCTNGVVTLIANTTCTATFIPVAQTYTLSIVKTGTGSGTVTSSSGGINCGNACSASYNTVAAVSLTATPATGSTFGGWSGTGCTSGNVTINVTISANTTCTATFQSSVNQMQSRIGVFRPSTGEWFLDDNGNGRWDTAIHISSFGQTGDVPVVGSWSGNGVSNIGVFTPATGTWQLDTTGDGILDCAVDTCVTSFGQPGDFPVTREMGGTTGSVIGTYTPETIVTINGRSEIKRGRWNFDIDNSTFDGCSIDQCDTFGTVGELPIVGDWNGTGIDELALFLPKNGTWYLDRNGNEKWDGCTKDKCLGQFGAKGDLPVVGDWDNRGKIKIGVFRPSTGMWYLDMNGNGKLDSCKVDACLGPFGQPGDLPVVGKW